MKGENKTDREVFKELILTVERFSQEDIDYLMEDLDNLGFFKMPSSCRNHGSYEGGLVKHSINVCRVAREITPLVTLIHVADSLAADLIERPYTSL